MDIGDDTLREAVREALNGAALTAESLKDITFLRIPYEKLPEDLSGLKQLPSLEAIEISQSAAKDVAAHPELKAYRIELFGGAAK